MKRFICMSIMVVMAFCFVACEETEEGVDNNNDIIIRNASEFYLWIAIDGNQRGRIENDGIAKTMWDNIPDGIHVLQAYRDEGYTQLHCSVTTDLLEGDDDFAWYLLENNRFEGTKDGDC